MSKSKGRKGSKTWNPMEGLPSRPRLCRLVKGSGGYGFNLHGQKGEHGQFIRVVDPGSPADVAGVREGDRVIEVSGINIERETHSQVVTRIRNDGGKTVLLVADRELDAYCKKHDITIKADMIQEDEADDPPHVNGINGSVDAVVEIEQKSEQPKIVDEERLETKVEQKEESEPEVIAVPDPEPEPEPEEAQEPEEEPRPYENDVGVDEEVAAVTEAAEVHAEPPEPERELTPEPEPEREPTPEPPREPTPPPPEPVREPTPPPPEPVREPTPPPPEPVREPTPPPPEPEIEEVDAPVPLQTEPKVSQPPARPPAPKVESTGLDLSDMAKARALAAGQRKKKQAAQQDWRSKYNAFNQL